MSKLLLGSRWIEIDLDAIASNTRIIKSMLPAQVKLMAVVKADAYGHGAVEVARTVLEAGADYLGVTTLDEGIELRNSGIDAPVLVFAPVVAEEAELLVRYKLTATVAGRGDLASLSDAAARLGEKVTVHLKVETGMGRIGCFPEQAGELAKEIVSSGYFDLEGVYTHLSAAADPGYTAKQLDRFETALEDIALLGIKIPVRHACNSTATLLYHDKHFDMVRVGTLLYGQYPAGMSKEVIKLEDPWKLKARVIHLQELPRGSSVGYSRTFITKRPTPIAVIPLGYVDGLGLEPAAKPAGLLDLAKVLAKVVLNYIGYPLERFTVEVRGIKVPVVGKIGMQLSMLDVSRVVGVSVGDEVTVPARRTTAGRRIPRLYLRAHRPYKITSLAGATEPVNELDTGFSFGTGT